MKSFEDYFSFDALLGGFVRWRVAGKKGVGSVLPPRKSWMYEGFATRKKVSSELIPRRAIVRRIRHKFKGRPYSYYAFLHKAARPSNMAFIRRTARTLPYSEL